MPTWLDSELLWASGKAFLIALVLTPILRDVFRSYKIVDRPGQRKIHIHPIPRIGGIPIAVAYLVAMASVSESDPVLRASFWKLLPGAALIFATGLIDDFFNLKPYVKLAGEFLAACAVFAVGLRIDAIAEQPLPLWLSFLLTILWVLLATNSLNLIDGLDGLCAGVGLVATLTLFGAAVMHQNIPLAVAALPLAGALLGFLTHNMNPATVFLGDSGALLIGFLLGCYGMIWTQKTETLLSLVVPLLAMAIPLLDVSLAILRRFLNQQPVFGADRGHIHHRLLDHGLTPRKAVMVLYLFAAFSAGVAILLSSPLSSGYTNLLFLLILGVVVAAVRQLRYQEFQAAGQFLLGGEFQGHLRAKLQLERLQTQLLQCETEKDWWNAVCAFANEQGWVELCWEGPHGVLEHKTPGAVGEKTWSISIPFAKQGGLVIEASSSGKDSLIDIPQLVHVLQATVAQKQLAWYRLSALGS